MKIINVDGLVKSFFLRRLCKKPKIKARESRVARRIPPWRDRDWGFYEVVNVNSQNGYVAIFAALLMLVLISIIGFSASRVANTEVTMARNEIVYHRNFYMAEGAAIEASDTLGNIANLHKDMPLWVEKVAGELSVENVREYFKNPADRNKLLVTSTVPFQKSLLEPSRLRYIGGADGIAPGESLDPDKPKIHNLSLYGRCEWDGVSVVRIGYRAIY